MLDLIVYLLCFGLDLGGLLSGDRRPTARELRANRLARIRATRKRRAVTRWIKKGERRRALPDIGLHCRRCTYLLTGLTEPRCPECGEDFGPDSIDIPRRLGKK